MQADIVLRISGVRGMCADYKSFGDHVRKIQLQTLVAPLSPKDRAALDDELERIWNWYKTMPPQTKMVCLVPKLKAQHSTASNVDAAVSDHERTHAQLAGKEELWFRTMDAYLKKLVGEDWSELWAAVYELSESGLMDEVVDEALARIEAVIRSPEDSRVEVAKDQLGDDYEVLMRVADVVGRKFGTIDRLIAMIDEKMKR